MKWSIYIGKISGIKVFLHWTLVFFLIWIGINSFRGGGNLNEMYYSLLFIVSVFVCVLLHELGHSITAKRLGYETKSITLLPIGGMAQMTEIPEKPKHELAVALAGPLVNLVIGTLLIPLLLYLNGVSKIDLVKINTPGNFILNLTVVNFSLAFFNLLPAFPMDGGRVLRALLAWKTGNRVKSTQTASNLGKIISVIFFITGIFFNPMLALIGVFIFLMAHSENEMVKSKNFLRNYKVKDVVMKKYFTLETHNKISDAVKLLLDVQATDFLIMKNEMVAGTLSRDNIIAALSKNGNETSIDQAMNSNFKSVDIQTELDAIYPAIMGNGNSIMPVFENGKLVGIIDGYNIMEFLLVKNSVKSKTDY